jgi:hypothetical protein
MSYKITEHSKKQAKKLGVEIRPSSKKNKKIDVIKNGKVVASIGDNRYGDYGTFLEKNGLVFANERRRLYRIRHAGENKKIGSPGYFSWFLLW